MRIYGEFNDIGDAHTYRVEIGPSGDTETFEIGSAGALSDGGSPSGILCWDDTPVTLEYKSDNWEDVIIDGKCTVNVVTDTLLSGLYANESTDVPVKVTCDGDVLFMGYVEPRAYSQAYSGEVNGLSLNCSDRLSTLKYFPYKGVRTRGDYDAAIRSASMVSFRDVLKECLSPVFGTSAVYYDTSKALPSGTGVLFDNLFVNTSLFLGGSADDVKSCYSVLEDLLRYLGLHALEWCDSVYLFSRENIGKPVTWWLMSGTPTDSDAAVQWTGGVLDTSHLGGLDGTVDIGEVFNQISLTVSPTSSESVLRSMLDSGGTLPVVGQREKYVTEYAADGEGKTAARSFWEMIKNGVDDSYTSKQWRDWYVRPMRNVYWDIGNGSGPGSHATDLALSYLSSVKASGGTPDGATLVDKLSSGTPRALLVSDGIVDHKAGTGDSSKQATLSMTTQFVISVNGNGSDTSPSPTDDTIKSSIPLASYRNGDAAAVYSPSDPGIKNYLVISGSVLLTPNAVGGGLFDVEKVRSYSNATDYYEKYAWEYGGFPMPFNTKSLANLNPSQNNKDGRYLAYEWHDGQKSGWTPNTETGPKLYRYQSSDGKDTVSKFDVLWCMLRIGDQVLVEDKSCNGELSSFSWQAYRPLSACADADDYLSQTFTIGIDPKVGDYIIGEEHAIGTNFDYSVNISADGGMAIPLPYDAHLRGDLYFDILGADNGPWEDYHKTRHATMFRHSQWSTTVVPILSHVGSVILTNFSMKFYSDGTDSNGDDDIVYLSRSDRKYNNKKEISGGVMHSGFTSEEINAYDLNNKLLPSTVCDASGTAVLSVRDTLRGETGKPEKLYVDALWRYLHVPRLSLTQSVVPAVLSPFGRYTAPGIDRTLYLRSWKSDLGSGVCKGTFSELP